MSDPFTTTPANIATILMQRFGQGDPGSGLSMDVHEAHMLMSYLDVSKARAEAAEAEVARLTPPPESPNVTINDFGDAVCQHGRAMDVHCCHCHSGFIFDKDHVCHDDSDPECGCEQCGSDENNDGSARCQTARADIAESAVARDTPAYKVIKVLTTPTVWMVRGQDRNGNWVRNVAMVYDEQLAQQLHEGAPPWQPRDSTPPPATAPPSLPGNWHEIDGPNGMCKCGTVEGRCPERLQRHIQAEVARLTTKVSALEWEIESGEPEHRRQLLALEHARAEAAEAAFAQLRATIASGGDVA